MGATQACPGECSELALQEREVHVVALDALLKELVLGSGLLGTPAMAFVPLDRPCSLAGASPPELLGTPAIAFVPSDQRRLKLCSVTARIGHLSLECNELALQEGDAHTAALDALLKDPELGQGLHQRRLQLCAAPIHERHSGMTRGVQ